MPDLPYEALGIARMERMFEDRVAPCVFTASEPETRQLICGDDGRVINGPGWFATRGRFLGFSDISRALLRRCHMSFFYGFV